MTWGYLKGSDWVLDILYDLAFILQKLDDVDNEDICTQIHVFSQSKNQDADELGHRYENIQFEMEYPFDQALWGVIYLGSLLVKLTWNLFFSRLSYLNEAC